jgi:hypothetical protein
VDEWAPRPQRRPLVPAERALLHRVIGLVDGKAGYAYTMRPGLRDVLGDGAVPQARELAVSERQGLDDMIRLALMEAGRRHPVENLTSADTALLHVIRKGISPRHEPGDERILVNIDDWMPPVAFPVDWKVANSPAPVDGFVKWEENDGPYARFYAAAPEWVWGGLNDYGEPPYSVRPVVPMADSYIAACVDNFLVLYGLSSPEEIGLTTAEAALALGFPWKGVTGQDDREPYLADLFRLEYGTRPWRPSRPQRPPRPPRRGTSGGGNRPRRRAT